MTDTATTPLTPLTQLDRDIARLERAIADDFKAAVKLSELMRELFPLDRKVYYGETMVPVEQIGPFASRDPRRMLELLRAQRAAANAT